jgi:hypothetical protein
MTSLTSLNCLGFLINSTTSVCRRVVYQNPTTVFMNPDLILGFCVMIGKLGMNWKVIPILILDLFRTVIS